MRQKIILSIFSIFIGMLFGVISNAKQIHDQVKLSAEGQKQHPKKILVLHQFKSRQDWTKLFNRYLLEALKREKLPSWELRSEYLDLLEFNDEAYTDMLKKQLLYKYTLSSPDVVVLELDAALQFVLENNLFPDTPKIAAITSRTFKPDSDNLFIVKLQFNLEESLKHAFELQPATQNVYVVCESISPVGKSMVTGFRNMSERIFKQKTFHYYTGMNVEEILNRSTNLPEDSFIFMLPYSRDPDGNPVTTADFARQIGENANRPVFTFLDLFALNTGILGGKVTTTRALAEQTSYYIKEVLSGKTQEIAIPKTEYFEYIYDWGAIQKWNIDIDKLPASSLIQNRTYTMFELFKWEIIGGTLLLIGESIIVIFLIGNIRRRRQAESRQLEYLTKLKSSEETLRNNEKRLTEAEEKYRTVANFTYGWEYWQGTDGKMIYVSPSSERISGYSPDEFIANGNLLDEIVVKEESPEWQYRACDIGKNSISEVESFVFKIQRKDGQNRWIEHIGQPVYDSEGNSLGIRASNRDITKRYEAELALKSSEANLRAYMDNTGDLICARDQEGSLIFWNEAFNQSCIRNFGVEASVGLKTMELIPPEQRKNFVEKGSNWRKVFKGEVVEVEYDFILPNGEMRTLITKWTPIEIDKRIEWAAEITQDITQRKLAEENLQRSEQQLRLIADSLPVFISYVDHNEHYIYINKAYLDFFKLTFDQIVGMPVKDVLGPEAYKHVRPHLKKALEGEQIWFEAEIIRSDRKHQIESNYLPDKDKNGQVVGFFVLATDVTERRHREAELQRHREELAHVSRLTTMGELTASMAHELNQPLTAILSNAQAARRFLENDPVDLEEVKEILDDIIDDDRRADQVIKKLRGFLKRGEFHLKTWDINAVIREVVTLVHSDAVIRNVSVHLDLVEELPPVLGDRIQIQQVLLNLIINGLDAMSDVHQKPRDLMIKSEYESNKEVKVSVADSGTGILPGQMQLIFEPFHTTKADGMGMGLSINRSIIRAHQGKLWVENNVNQGATFIFTLPVASEDNTDGQ